MAFHKCLGHHSHFMGFASFIPCFKRAIVENLGELPCDVSQFQQPEEAASYSNS